MERNIKLLALFNFFTDLDFLAPVAIIYFASVSGSYALGMSIFSVVFLSSALFEVPTGIFSDRIGRKKTVVCGALAGLIGAIVIASIHSYAFLLVGAVLMGLARSFYSGNNDALLYDSLRVLKKEQQYHGYLGKLSSVFQIALALSAVSGGLIANWSFSFLLWICVLPKFILFVVSLWLTEPPVVKKESANIFSHVAQASREFRKNQKLTLLTVASSLRFALGESAYLFRGAFVATLWPLWAVGISSMLSNIGAAASYYFSGKLIDRFSSYSILVFEIIFNRAVNLLALFFPSVVSPALMSSTSLTFGVGDVAINSLMQKEFTHEERATMGSVVSFLGYIVFAACSFSLGLVADVVGPAKTLIMVHLILLIPLFFYKKIFGTPKKI
jgi:MFS family permease